MKIFCEAYKSVCVGPRALGPQRSLCRGVSGPPALCVGARARSVGPSALCVPGALCVGTGALCQVPALSASGSGTLSLICVGPCSSAESASISREPPPPTRIRAPPIRSRGPPAPTRVPPIRLRAPSHPSGPRAPSSDWRVPFIQERTPNLTVWEKNQKTKNTIPNNLELKLFQTSRRKVVFAGCGLWALFVIGFVALVVWSVVVLGFGSCDVADCVGIFDYSGSFTYGILVEEVTPCGVPS